VTQRSTVMVAEDHDALGRRLEQLRPKRMSAERFARRVNAGTIDQHVTRFRELATAGVQTAMVSLPDVDDPGVLERFGEVIAACS